MRPRSLRPKFPIDRGWKASEQRRPILRQLFIVPFTFPAAYDSDSQRSQSNVFRTYDVGQLAELDSRHTTQRSKFPGNIRPGFRQVVAAAFVAK